MTKEELDSLDRFLLRIKEAETARELSQIIFHENESDAENFATELNDAIKTNYIEEAFDILDEAFGSEAFVKAFLTKAEILRWLEEKDMNK